jgi:hypothetical protein
LIANCGQLGLDWRTADLSDYLEALEAHNEAHSSETEPRQPADLDRLRRFMAAHKAAGSAAAVKG